MLPQCVQQFLEWLQVWPAAEHSAGLGAPQQAKVGGVEGELQLAILQAVLPALASAKQALLLILQTALSLSYTIL